MSMKGPPGIDADYTGTPDDPDRIPASEHGLEWGDIQLIRDKLRLTPTERLLAAQELMNAALRIRAQNDDRA